MRSDGLVQTVAQTNVARIERLLKVIRGFGFQRSHRERLTHPPDELLESGIVEKGNWGQGRRVKDQREQGLPKGKLVRIVQIVKLSKDQWVNSACTFYLESSV